MEDARLLWQWANDPDTRRNAFTHAPVAYKDHVRWLERKLASDSCAMWMFSDDDATVGQVRFDIAGHVADIDISVAPERRGRGYGRTMLAQAVENLRGERGINVRPRAVVLAHNAASLRMFKACGFHETGVDDRDASEPALVLEPVDFQRSA